MSVKQILIIALVSLTGISYAQHIDVKFLGRSRIDWIKLDSVVVSNETRGWKETVVAPDSIISLELQTGISQYKTDRQAKFSQNTPNPFYGTTEVTFFLPKEENVHFAIFDILGKEDVQRSMKLSAGYHAFKITLSKPQTYFFTASTSMGIASIKMVNLLSSSQNDNIEYTGWKLDKTTPALKKSNAHAFGIGDKMKYTAYAMQYGEQIVRTVTQNQYENATIIFDMENEFDLVSQISGKCDGVPFISNYLYDNDYHLVQITTTDSALGTSNIYFTYLDNRVKSAEYISYGENENNNHTCNFSYNALGYLKNRVFIKNGDTILVESFIYDSNNWLRTIIRNGDTTTIKATYDRNGNITKHYVQQKDSVTGKLVDTTFQYKYDYHRKPYFNTNYLFTEELYPHAFEEVTWLKNIAYNNLIAFVTKGIQWTYEYNDEGLPISIVTTKGKNKEFEELHIFYKNINNQQ